MLTANDLTAIIVAITGLIVATTALIAAFRQIHARVDQTDDALLNHTHPAESSSTKVPPPPNP